MSQCPECAAYEGEHIREGEDKIGLIKRTVVGGPRNLFLLNFPLPSLLTLAVE